MWFCGGINSSRVQEIKFMRAVRCLVMKSASSERETVLFGVLKYAVREGETI